MRHKQQPIKKGSPHKEKALHANISNVKHHITDPKNCQYFINCKAPLCPLDKYINKRTMIKGEAICRLWSKQIRDKKRGCIASMTPLAVPNYSNMPKSCYTPLKNALERIYLRVYEF